MQLIPDTAKRFGVKNSYNPHHNIRGGVSYLRFLLDRYKGDLHKTIAAYNAGEGKVDQYKGIPPYKETKQYVKNVLRIYEKLNPLFARINARNKRVSAIYYPPGLGQKPGRHGWKYNRLLAPHLYKQTTSK
jgi:soluble lytic murein transglycosylase-like protein